MAEVLACPKAILMDYSRDSGHQPRPLGVEGKTVTQKLSDMASSAAKTVMEIFGVDHHIFIGLNKLLEPIAVSTPVTSSDPDELRRLQLAEAVKKVLVQTKRADDYAERTAFVEETVMDESYYYPTDKPVDASKIRRLKLNRKR